MAGKMLYRDIVPNDVPSSLDDLRGPAAGTPALPRIVHWGPRQEFDLGRPALRRAAYRAIVGEGTREVQEELLNADILRQILPGLILPGRCRSLWEDRFPELVPA